MLSLLVSCESQKLLHLAPVLHQDDGAREPHFGVNEAEIGLAAEFFEHARHGLSHRKPLVDRQVF